MKRYLVFAYNSFYPYGGWDDFQGSFDLYEEARDRTLELEADFSWFQIIDLETEEKV